MNGECEFKAGDIVSIPSSNLGKTYGLGRVTAVWNGIMAVDFSGHLGQYTIAKHVIVKPAEILPGITIHIDETLGPNEFYFKFPEGTRFP